MTNAIMKIERSYLKINITKVLQFQTIFFSWVVKIPVNELKLKLVLNFLTRSDFIEDITISSTSEFDIILSEEIHIM